MTDKTIPTALPAQGLVLLALLMLVWGASWPIMKIAAEGMPIIAFRAVAGLSGGLTLMVLAKLGGHSWQVPRQIRKTLVVAAFFNITCWLFFSALGLTLMPSGHAAVVAYTMPLWAFIISIPLLGEKPRAANWIGLGFGLTAVGVLAARGWTAFGEAPWGVVVMLGGAVLWGLGTVLNKRAAWPMPMIVVTAWQVILGTIPMILLVPLEFAELVWPPLDVVLATAYSGVIGLAIGFWTWFRIIEMVPAPVASVSVLVVPGAGLICGALILGEDFGASEIVALGCLIAALVTVMPRSRK